MGSSAEKHFFVLSETIYHSQHQDSLLANVAPRDYSSEYTPSAYNNTNIDSVKSKIVRGNYKKCTFFLNPGPVYWDFTQPMFVLQLSNIVYDTP